MQQIAHDEFPIPNLPPPRPIPNPITDDQGRLISPLPSSPPEPQSSQEAAEADKENAPAAAEGRRLAPAPTPPVATAPDVQRLEPGELPKQIADMLADITQLLGKFDRHPPHTIQRLAELVLRPSAHYRALATYLHAVDRVVRVTSSMDKYPLPPAVPDMSSFNKDEGEDANDPASQVAWSNPTSSTLGTDEALGGALLTPIPWLTRRSPDKVVEAPGVGAQIHSESTETIDGPNGMGSIETVTVSVNGIRSAGHAARAITQGELLRQEQRAGVVPVIQLSRSQEAANGNGARRTDEGNNKEEDSEPRPGPTEGDIEEEEEGEAEEGAAAPAEDEDEEVPHARGPEEIGINDTGPQRQGTTLSGPGLDAHDIDVEAAVGRKHGDEESKTPPPDTKAEDGSPAAESPSSSSSAMKRGAESSPGGEPATKQVKDREDKSDDAGDDSKKDVDMDKVEDDKPAESTPPGDDKMDTDK